MKCILKFVLIMSIILVFGCDSLDNNGYDEDELRDIAWIGLTEEMKVDVSIPVQEATVTIFDINDDRHARWVKGSFDADHKKFVAVDFKTDNRSEHVIIYIDPDSKKIIGQYEFHPTIEDAIKEYSQFDIIYHIEHQDEYDLVFYGDEKVVKVVTIEKGKFGYRWAFGTGSHGFETTRKNEVSLSFHNINYKRYSDEFVSFFYGGIYNDDIEELKITYEDHILDPTIISTPYGRFWFSLSEVPVSYDPNIIRVYKNGEEKVGNN